VAIEPVLHQKFLYLFLLLRVEQGVIFVLGVRVTVESEQVDRGWPALFLLQNSNLQESTAIGDLNPHCIGKIIYFGDGGEVRSIF